MAAVQKIRPFLWFDHDAEDAANFYVSLFPGSSILKVTHCGDAGPGAPGSILTINFELAGVQFVALNGGPHFKFNEAISLVADCQDQAEVDDLWNKLGDGGAYSRCGWLKDRYGLSWQIVPTRMPALLGGPDAAGASRAMAAMLEMTKIDIGILEAAYDGR